MNLNLNLMRAGALVATLGVAVIAHGHGSSHPAKRIDTPTVEVAPYVKWQDGMRVLRYLSHRTNLDSSSRILVCERPFTVGHTGYCTTSDEDKTNRWQYIEQAVPAGYQILGINYGGDGALTAYLIPKK